MLYPHRDYWTGALAWGQFVATVKGLLSTAALQHLRQRYQLEQYWWRHF